MDDGKCYHDVPVNITIGNKYVKAFLNPITLVALSTSRQDECESFRYSTLMIEGKFWKIDQWTAEKIAIDDESIRMEKIGSDSVDAFMNVELHIFARDALNNFSNEQADLLQLLHHQLGHKGLDVNTDEERVKGKWFNHEEANEFTLSRMLLGFGIDVWEIFERFMCILGLTYVVWKLWVWKNKQLSRKFIRHVIKEEVIGTNQKNFGGSVADQRLSLQATNYTTAVVVEAEMGRTPEAADDVPQMEAGGKENEKRRKRRWY